MEFELPCFILLSFRQFCRLPKNDQRLLLARNSSLYIQLYMGCFFGAPSGAQQKDLIKKYQIITRKQKLLEYTMDNQAKFIDMHQLNSITRLFREDADLDVYVKLIDVFKGLKCITSLESRAIISYLILFDYDDSLSLTGRDMLKKIDVKKQELFDRVLVKSCGISMQELMTTLVKMSVFGAYNIRWDDVVLPTKKTGLTGFNVVMAYTDEEEAWLKKQTEQFDELFFSVSFGEDLMKEAMMNSLGVPLCKNFMNKKYAIFLERLWRVGRFNPELASMTIKETEQLKANCKQALGLYVSKLENSSDGLDQVSCRIQNSNRSCFPIVFSYR